MANAHPQQPSFVRLTAEQEQICASSAKLLLVHAFAGCGKTSTLVEYARRHPDLSFVYLAFNKAIKEEAAQKFPKNVRCLTTHSLAFGRFGKPYAHKLDNAKPYHLESFLKCSALMAADVLAIITTYLSSADKVMADKHGLMAGLKPAALAELLPLTHKAWAAMQDVNNAAVPMPHDGYLKLYQLSNPKINADCILFDEGQDANPLTLDIVLKQGCRKVIVGDSHQSIYGFRGAVNAMTTVKAEMTLQLTQSWRFGQGIGRFATTLLQHWKQETAQVHGKGKWQTEWQVDRLAPHAIISRTNAALFVEAVRALESGKPFGFVGGVSGYKFDLVNDAYQLSIGARHSVKDPSIKRFAEWNDLKQYAGELDDKELQFLVRTVDTFGRRIPGLVERIKREACADLKDAERVLTTAHKSKGLEWDSVVLLEDFTDLSIDTNPETGEEIGPEPEEINLLYVAATRALRCLQLPEAVRVWLEDVNPDLYQEIQRNVNAERSESTPARQEPPPSPTPVVEDEVPEEPANRPVDSFVTQIKWRESYAGSAAAGCVAGLPFVLVGANPEALAKIWQAIAKSALDVSDVHRVAVLSQPSLPVKSAKAE